MTKPFDNLRNAMSEDQRYMADQLAQLQVDSIQRDKMFADMEQEVHSAMLRVQDAVITLRDYDGHYDRETETGDATELANVIDEAVKILTSRNYEPTQVAPQVAPQEPEISNKECCKGKRCCSKKQKMREEIKKVREIKEQIKEQVREIHEGSSYTPTKEPEMMNEAKELVEKMEAIDAISELSEEQGFEDTHNPLIKDKEAERNRIANGIMASESFMWLMVGANHPESHCANLRNAWAAWLDNGGKGWGKREPDECVFVRGEKRDVKEFDNYTKPNVVEDWKDD